MEIDRYIYFFRIIDEVYNLAKLISPLQMARDIKKKKKKIMTCTISFVLPCNVVKVSINTLVLERASNLVQRLKYN